MALCSSCGNEVMNPAHCPVCEAGRGARKSRQPAPAKPVVSACQCPRCGDPLTDQDIEGCTTLMCPSCQGMFFPDQTLERVLNRLRATCDPTDVHSAMQEFKDRFTRALPESVKYKQCPVCDGPMTRRNYGTVSGVIVDVCYEHGTWVDGSAFGELADFIVRGGDLVAEKANETRARAKPGAASGGHGSIFGKLLGSE